jgi:allantoicase
VESNFKRAPLADYASAAFGASLARATNEHYGPAAQVISPYPPIHMFDGLESARSRVPGHSEEVVIRLGRPTRVARVVLDFTWFVNNNPVAVDLEGLEGAEWVPLATRVPVKAFAGNAREIRVAHERKISELRVRTWPDGGINRIRVFDR